jgi:hypothetical protein
MGGARYRFTAMTHAFVLIKAERDAMHSLGGGLADVEGVTMVAFEVFSQDDLEAMFSIGA